MNPELFKLLNRLAKWRTVLAGWQIGTRPADDPTAAAIKDHREITIFLRAEVSAISNLLIDKGVFSKDEFDRQLMIEAQELDKGFEQRFPGIKAVDDGIIVEGEEGFKTMSKFPK